MNTRLSLVSALVLTLAALAGCAGQVDENAGFVTQGTHPLEATFAQAAREYQVPEGVLRSVGYVETRLNPKPGQASINGGFGMMNLTERPDWNMLRRAAELTGVTEGELKASPAANIRGAAAVLRELADKSFAQYGHLDPSNPADWFHAVSLYPGIDSALTAQDYARDVYRALADGFVVEREEGTFVQRAEAFDLSAHLPAVAVKRDAVKEYPGADVWDQSPNYTPASRTSANITHVLIHTTQGSYAGSVSWFNNPSSNVSSHYLVRSSDGHITQMVEHSDIAWHASCYNGRSVGIEHEGFVADPARWYTENLYRESALLTRWITDRHAIPKDRTRIIGHAEVPLSCNSNRHTDPGTGWNWTKYMNLVRGSTPTTTTGKLTGVIYTGGDLNKKVAGATVTAAGKTATTGTDGLYEIIVNPGTYTVAVSKSGYSSNSVSKSVTSGGTTWGSMEINPNAAPTTGSLIGYVYQGGVNDAAHRIAGASVTVGSTTKTTGTDGKYEFTLAAGTYTVSATKSGFTTASASKAITAGATTWGSLEINPQTVTKGTLTGYIFQGGVNDAAHRVAGATVTVGSSTVTTGSDGKYTFALNPGTYTVSVAKSGFSSSSVSKTITSGATTWGSMEINPVAAPADPGRIIGFIYVGAVNEPATRISGVTVTAGSQTIVTAADGKYVFSLAPGRYTVTASKSGYVTQSVVRDVTSGADVYGSMSLQPVAAQPADAGSSNPVDAGSTPVDAGGPVVDTVAPALSIVFPPEAGEFDYASLPVSGQTSDDHTDLMEVTVSHNGAAAESVAVAGGGYQHQVKLSPGQNTIVVSVVDAAGNRTTEQVTVTFNAGVSGFVHLREDEAARLAGATVKVLSVDGGFVGETVADDNGVYHLDLAVVGEPYVAVASKPGFVTYSETFTASDEERTALNLGLVEGADVLPTEYVMTFFEPADNSTVTTETVTVYGSVSFGMVAVTANGTPGEPLGAGGFSVTVPLSVGANTIEVVATGANNERVVGTLHVTREEYQVPSNPTAEANFIDGGKTGCSAVFGFEILGLLALAPLFRKRRA